MTILVPSTAWQTVVSALRLPPHDRERVAYLDGRVTTDHVAVVSTVTIPEAENTAGHFTVSAHNMSRAGKHLRRFGLLRLAQIHSHPTDWTGHSDYDDEKAYSQRDGAISIVVPDYAGCFPSPADCGIHVREPNGWRQLNHDDAVALVVIIPSLIQLTT